MTQPQAQSQTRLKADFEHVAQVSGSRTRACETLGCIALCESPLMWVWEHEGVVKACIQVPGLTSLSAVNFLHSKQRLLTLRKATSVSIRGFERQTEDTVPYILRFLCSGTLAMIMHQPHEL